MSWKPLKVLEQQQPMTKKSGRQDACKRGGVYRCQANISMAMPRKPEAIQTDQEAAGRLFYQTRRRSQCYSGASRDRVRPWRWLHR